MISAEMLWEAVVVAVGVGGAARVSARVAAGSTSGAWSFGVRDHTRPVRADLDPWDHRDSLHSESAFPCRTWNLRQVLLSVTRQALSPSSHSCRPLSDAQARTIQVSADFRTANSPPTLRRPQSPRSSVRRARSRVTAGSGGGSSSLGQPRSSLPDDRRPISAGGFRCIWPPGAGCRSPAAGPRCWPA